MMDLNTIERRAIEMMLAGWEDVRVGYLREQMESASATKRSYTGYGFFTQLSVPEACPSMPGEPSFHISNVRGGQRQVATRDRVSLHQERSHQHLGGAHV